MVMGPCGGVRADGDCELEPRPCAFPVPERWADPVRAVPLRSVPLIVTDFTSEPYSAASHRSVAAILAPVSDVVLVGDHQRRPDFPPSVLAWLLQDVGARPWITLTCRDRNRVALEQELAALRELDVAAVLCVTGDGRPRTNPGAAQVFDLDGPRLTALAAAAGLSAVAAETPAAPPRSLRPYRLAQKQRAGAAAAVLNHDAVESVAGFMAGAAEAGLTIPVFAAVALFTDERSAAAISVLPGLELDQAAARRVLASPDPVAAGIAHAAAEARALLRIPGIAGVNISGLASARGYEFAARVKAELAVLVREEFGEGRDRAT
jgi:5,10-methylenetetrahydrofolate reductase